MRQYRHIRQAEHALYKRSDPSIYAMFHGLPHRGWQKIQKLRPLKEHLLKQLQNIIFQHHALLQLPMPHYSQRVNALFYEEFCCAHVLVFLPKQPEPL